MPRKQTLRTVEDFIRWGERVFDDAHLVYGHGTDNALDEAAWIVTSVLKISFDELDTRLAHVLSTEERAAVRAIIERRIATRKPTAYILHEAWFAGLRFYVDERVIVPRSHLGEFIQEQFEPWINPDEIARALDLCTGSGCIAIALAHAFPQAVVDASDISEEALAVAQINVEAHGLKERVHVRRSDLFTALRGPYDLIVTNPPYVDEQDMAALAEEYRHEPTLALTAGRTGLDVIIRILAESKNFLTPAGILVAEVGNSCVALQEKFPAVPFVWLTTSSGDESVFMLTAAQLRQHADVFARAIAG